jgi:hypothetical protein
MPEAIFIKPGMNIMAPEPILTAYFINPSHQAVSNPSSLLVHFIVLKGVVGFSLSFIFCMPWYYVNEQYYELLGFCTSSIVRYSKKQKSTTFRKLDLFPSSGEGAGDTNSVGPVRKN